MPLAEFSAQFPTPCARLLAARRRQAWAHAYLLLGDSAALLERFALTWAQACTCPHTTAAGDACGACDHCRRVMAGKSPDLCILRPRSKSRRILVEEVRELERTLGLTTTGDNLKIALLLDADRMNEQAQNAFLKTLEEPTPRTLLLLTSTHPRLLLPTVRSRCQVVSLLANRHSYELVTRLGLFPALAKIRFGAGAAAALAGCHALATVFAQVRQQTEAETADPDSDPQLQAMLAADTALRKQIEEERAAAKEADYLNVRQEVIAAISAWHQQLFLIAAGVALDKLPHPEFLDACEDPSIREQGVSREEGERGLRIAEELAQGLAANVDERLCLESYCLTVCERPQPPATL